MDEPPFPAPGHGPDGHPVRDAAPTADAPPSPQTVSPQTVNQSSRNRLLPFLAALAGLFATLAVVQNDWAGLRDPHWLLDHDRWHGFGDGRLGWMLETIRGGFPRPLAWLSLGLDGALYGALYGALRPPPAFVHGISVVLHALTAYLLAGLFIRLLTPPDADISVRRKAAWCGALAAAAWAAHPLRVEAVAWASARGELLAVLLGVAAARLLYRALASERLRVPALLGSVFLATAAVLSDPLVVGLPLALVAMVLWTRRTRPGSVAAWASPAALLGTGLVFLIPVGIGLAILLADGLAGSPGVPSGPLWLARSAGVMRGLRDTLLPLELIPGYDPPAGFPGTGLTALYLDAGLCLAVVGVTVVGLRRATPSSLVGLTFLGLLMPQLVFGHQPAGADRFAALATTGFFLSAAVGIGSWAVSPARRRTALVTTAFLVLFLGLLSARQTTYWKDAKTLEQRILDVDPSNAGGLATSGLRMRREGGSWANSTVLFRRSTDLGSYRGQAHALLGAALLEKGDAAAEDHLRRAIELAPWLSEPRQELGALKLHDGTWNAAREQLRWAARLDDRSASIWFALAKAELILNDNAAAKAALLRARELAPDDPSVREALERLEAE